MVFFLVPLWFADNEPTNKLVDIMSVINLSVSAKSNTELLAKIKSQEIELKVEIFYLNTIEQLFILLSS